MSKKQLTIISALVLTIAILVYALNEKQLTIDMYKNIQEIDNRAIEGFREEVRKQDSIIEYLYQIKVTKITIIEKDTVR
jgi:hypothetical protein